MMRFDDQTGRRDLQALDQNVESSPYVAMELEQPHTGRDARPLKHTILKSIELLFDVVLKTWQRKRNRASHQDENGDCEKLAEGMERIHSTEDRTTVNDSKPKTFPTLLGTKGIFLLLISYAYWVWLQSFVNVGLQSHGARENSIQNVFQLYQPPSAPFEPLCTRLLVSHTFANSYGHPFIGGYKPPDPISYPHINSATLRLTVKSRGRQFDRLALLFLGDVEIFRTSTAEPSPDGITWTYEKDVSAYMALWRQEQRVVFDLGNLLNDVLTGSFEVRVEVSFARNDGLEAADLVLPISSMRSKQNKSSAFSLPGDRAGVYHKIPSIGEGKPARALISIAACGQASEEFWYSNALDEDTGTFRNTTGDLYGHSPFREVQIWIDGNLAGVAWPFPIIFTGGIAPGLWRPIVGIDAFDLRETEIDITPWLPWLTDGRAHEFRIEVVGLRREGNGYTVTDRIGSHWVVTGKIFLFFDQSEKDDKAAAPDLPLIVAPDPVISVGSVSQPVNGTVRSLKYSVKVSRTINITSESGSWIQVLGYTSDNRLSQHGLTQSTSQSTDANSTSIDFRNPDRSFSVTVSYPLQVNTTIRTSEEKAGIRIDSSIARGLKIKSTGRLDSSLFTLTAGASELDTWQSGDAQYSNRPNRSYSFGETRQELFENSQQGIFLAVAEATNGSVDASEDEAWSSFATSGLRDMVGRGRSPSSLKGHSPTL